MCRKNNTSCYAFLAKMHANKNRLFQALFHLVFTFQRLLNSFLANGDFCRLLITFAYSFDPYKDRHITRLTL